MDIGKLVASDFPGIDETKFNEWKTLKLKDTRKKQISLSLTIVVTLVLARIMKPAGSFLIIIIPWALILGFGVYLETDARRLRQLGKELEMSARMRAKQERNSYTG